MSVIIDSAVSKYCTMYHKDKSSYSIYRFVVKSDIYALLPRSVHLKSLSNEVANNTNLNKEVGQQRSTSSRNV